jgi:hypothetical protein
MLYPVELQALHIRAVFADSWPEEPLRGQVFVQYLLQFGNSWYWVLPAWIGLCDKKVTSVKPKFKIDSSTVTYTMKRPGAIAGLLFSPHERLHHPDDPANGIKERNNHSNSHVTEA